MTEKDLCYEEDKSGNNPIMIAAKLRNKDLVKNELRTVDHIFYKSCIFLPYLRKSRNLSRYLKEISLKKVILTQVLEIRVASIVVQGEF